MTTNTKAFDAYIRMYPFIHQVQFSYLHGDEGQDEE